MNVLGGDASNDYDYEDGGAILEPPAPAADEPFEQAESSYEEPVYDTLDDESAGQSYGGPTQPNSLYDAPVDAREGRQGRGRQGRLLGRNGGGPRRRPNSNRRRGMYIVQFINILN